MKHAENKKIKISTILLVILIIVAIALIIRIYNKSIERKQNEQDLTEILSELKEEIENTDEMPYVTYKGYQVIGVISIPKINIEYPILIECTEQTLNISISRVGNGEVNEIGNLALAGHNYINNTMFGAIDELEIGDEIKITDLYGSEITYEVFDIYITNPNDGNVLNSVEEETKEITLMTCKNGNKNRLIVKAREN